MRFLPPLFGLCFSVTLFAATSLPEGWKTAPGVSWKEGRAVFDSKRDATLEMTIPALRDDAWALILAEGPGSATFSFLVNGEEAGRWQMRKGKAADALDLSTLEPSADHPGKWSIVRGSQIALPYRPAERAAFVWKNLKAAGLDPKGWAAREIEVRLMRRADRVEMYLDGVLVVTRPVGEKETFAVQWQLPKGDAARPLGENRLEVAPKFQPLAIKAFTPDGGARPDRLETVDAVPFLRPAGGAGVDLRKACWPFAREMPSNYFAAYDSGPMFLHDLRVPTFWAPVADYAALHLLVRKTPEAPGQANRFSIRIGSFGMGALGGRGQVLDHVYHAEIPAASGVQHLVVPITEVIAQDIKGGALQIGFNKEMRLARRSPDPSRFEYKPLGLPPGVEIVGATLERSPIQWQLKPLEPGAVFEGEQKARFAATLRNVTGEPVDFALEAAATGSAGEPLTERLTGTLRPGETREAALTLEPSRWGHYRLEALLKIAKKTALRRVTHFALLPPDTRKEGSPFGTWTFDGGHQTCDDPAVLGPLLKKAGLHYGMGRFPKERTAWGVRNNFEAKGIDSPEKYEKWVATNPDALPVALLMHEHSISGDHVSRLPDLFTGRPPYKLNPKEKERFQTLWDEQVAMAKLMRAHFPKVHLRLGNGPLPTKEEFLRAHFPAELFDSIGNEAGSFGRLPEAQPPDPVGNNSSLWMDHEMVKAYGYDKPVTQCYEITYPSTNPGNLSPLDQAAYFVRHGLHSLAWGVPEIRFGCLDDCANAYRFSNWGASGMMHAWPHLNPKPSYVAVATMTRMLDGATYRRAVETGSPSVYAVELEKKDGRHVYVLWTLRGERPVKLQVEGAGWTLTDWEGNTPQPAEKGDTVEATLTAMPVYLTGNGTVAAVTLGEPRYPGRSGTEWKPVARLETPEGWRAATKRDPVLESHNPLTPRVPGRFEYSAAPGGGIAVRAEAADGPKAIPMYGALEAETPVELPGQPTEIALKVNGKSNWGRIIYELTDASGQKWISIGASRTGEISEWMLDWLPAEFAKSNDGPVTQADWNTNDVFGLSSLDFDGEALLRFPLPGNYPGEGTPWPANSQWRWDGDGVVHYPLKVTRLIFEMPKNFLKLTDYKPVADPSFTLRELSVAYGTQGGVKRGVYEEEE